MDEAETVLYKTADAKLGSYTKPIVKIISPATFTRVVYDQQGNPVCVVDSYYGLRSGKAQIFSFKPNVEGQEATDKLADGDKPLYLFAKVTFTQSGKSMTYKLTKGNDVPKGAKPAMRVNLGQMMRDTKDGVYVYKCNYTFLDGTSAEAKPPVVGQLIALGSPAVGYGRCDHTFSVAKGVDLAGVVSLSLICDAFIEMANTLDSGEGGAEVPFSDFYA